MSKNLIHPTAIISDEVKVGEGTVIGPYSIIDGNISIGKNTFVNFNCVFIDNNKIKIGSNVLIGPGVHFYTPSHPVKSKERVKSDGQYITNALPIKVGNNVWIGGNSSICQGVKIGSNTTIGANSLVLSDIPDGLLAYGNPCKVIKKL